MNVLGQMRRAIATALLTERKLAELNTVMPEPLKRVRVMGVALGLLRDCIIRGESFEDIEQRIESHNSSDISCRPLPSIPDAVMKPVRKIPTGKE